MPTEQEILIIQKAAMYDLMPLFEQDPGKSYTVEEVKKIIDAYVAGSEGLNPQ